MNNNIKICLVTGVILTIVVTFTFFRGNDRYNMSPDNSNKVIGSESINYARVLPESINDMIKVSDLVAKVTVVGREEVVEVTDNQIKGMPSDDPMQKTEVLITKVRLKIEEIYMGSSTSSIIYVHQLGKKDDDTFGETKLKDNETYIAFLLNTPQNNIYRSFAEHSYFKANNKKLLSLVKDKEFSKYDTISEGVLIDDIKKSKFYKKSK